MIRNNIILIALILGLALSGCKKNGFYNLTPKIVDDKVEVTATTATISWTVDWPGKLVSVVEVSENEAMADSRFYGSEEETSNHDFTVTVTDLEPFTKYYYRFLVWNRNFVDDKFVMEVKGFTTEADVPKVKTVEVTDVTRTSATVVGEVTDDCGAEVTERGICWSTSHNPEVTGSHANSGTGTGSFTVNMTGLTAGTTYYVRAYAKNIAGVSYGSEVSFATLNPFAPEVETATATGIGYNKATIGGEVTSDGGLDVTEHGVYWGTTSNPTTKLAIGSGAGVFSRQLTGLTDNTTYYYKAYAVNSVGENCGSVMSLTTLTLPEGTINGCFTINANGDQVWFSQGNLQYQASSNTWRFATNQYDYIGSANSNISQTYSGWIDLFGWGTSGWNCGNTYYRPWDSNNNNSDALYGPSGEHNLTGSYANSDWGYYNAISNGGNATHQWRTLTQGEWDYVFNTRNTSSGIRYAKAQVAGVNGVILLPDDWSTSYYSLNSTNSSGANFSSNVISSSDWANSLQSHGAVFLPAAGYRDGTSVYLVGSDGYYWSDSYNDSLSAWVVDFDDGYLYTGDANTRCIGFSVRLVCPAE